MNKTMFKNSRSLVSVIILNYNGRKFLEPCLKSVLQSNYPNFEIIFIDNGSTDNSRSLAKSRFGRNPYIKIFENEKNLGYTRVNEFITKYAKGDVIAFLDVDTVVDPNWLTVAIETVTSNDEIGAVQAKLLSLNKKTIDGVGDFIDYFGNSFIEGRDEEDKGLYDYEKDIFSGRGAALIIKREIFVKVDGVDPTFFIHLWDVDLGWRIRLAGYKTVFNPNMIVYHAVHHATGRLDPPFKLFHRDKNKITMMLKNYGMRNLLKYAWVPVFQLVLSMALDLLREQRRRYVITRILVLFWTIRNFKSMWRKRLRVQQIIRKVDDNYIMHFVLKTNIALLLRFWVNGLRYGWDKANKYYLKECSEQRC